MLMFGKLFFCIKFKRYKNKEYNNDQLKRFLEFNINNKKLKKFIEKEIYRISNNHSHIVFEESFFKDFIGDGNEKIICDTFNRDNFALLKKGKLKFIHNSFKGLRDKIEKEGLKPRSEIGTRDTDTDDTLGDGIYCYKYDDYIKNHKDNGIRVQRCSYVGNYDGEYIECIYGPASGSVGIVNGKSLLIDREYLLIDRCKIIDLKLIE